MTLSPLGYRIRIEEIIGTTERADLPNIEVTKILEGMIYNAEDAHDVVDIFFLRPLERVVPG